jgi:membrane protease YdiL (CAAX protease family)
MEESRNARQGLIAYLITASALAGLVTTALVVTGRPIETQFFLVALLMWAPGVASILVRIVRQEGFADVSFGLPRRGNRQELLVAWLWPLGVALVGYGTAWLAGVAHYEPPARLGSFPAIVQLPISIAISLTFATSVGSLFALGEELGWRGYMLTRMVTARWPRPILLSGLVWWAYHLPLILSGQYASGAYPALSAVLFGAGIIATSYVAARVRFKSGSIWPAVVLHASWNGVIQQTFDQFTRADRSQFWTGESGLLIVVALYLISLPLVAITCPVRRTPADDRAPTVRLLQL